MEISSSPWSKKSENENVAVVFNTQKRYIILAFDVMSLLGTHDNLAVDFIF